MSHQYPKPGPAKAASTWSRTGCVTCKRRRKKCDQGRPACTNCINRDIRCEGYQQLFVSHAIRGHNPRNGAASASHPSRHRRSFPAHPAPIDGTELRPRTSPQHFHRALPSADSPEPPWQQQMPPLLLVEGPASSPADLDDSFLDDGSVSVVALSPGSPRPSPEASPGGPAYGPSPVADRLGAVAAASDPVGWLVGASQNKDDTSPDGRSIDVPVSGIMPLTPSASLGSPHGVWAFPQFTEQDLYYIQYLHEQGAGQLLNMDAGPFNPLRCLFLPRAFNSSGVLNAMCAVAACHRARQCDPDVRMSISNSATGFYAKATSWLRTSLDQRAESLGSARLDDALIFTTILLCKYEIIHGSVRNWSGHLRGLENLVRSYGGIDALDLDCVRYISSFVRYHRTVAGIVNASYWASPEVDSTLEEVPPSIFSMDAYSGCSYYLLQACRAIARLAGCVEQREISGFKDFSARIQTIVASLGTSNIQSDTQACPEGVSIAQISRLLFVAQRIRYAAFVFLHSVLEYAQTIYSLGDGDWDTLLLRLPYTKTQAVDGCLEMLAEIPVGEHCEFAALTLPLFLAGCETADERKRYLVLERLFLMERGFGIGNIARARDALMMIWQEQRGPKRNFWWKTLQDMGWELILS